MTQRAHPCDGGPGIARAGAARGVALLLGIFLSLPLAALDSDRQAPIYIEADDVEVREDTNTSVYVGKVQVDQGSMRLRADHVTVYHRPDRQPRLIIALGSPATYQQQLEANEGELQAFAKRMEYDADKDELLLIGEGLLIQGADRLSGERILYDRGRAQFRAGGEGRVKITIDPERDTPETARPQTTPPSADSSQTR